MTAIPRPAYGLSANARAERAERVKALKAALRQRVLVLDGAMGTAVQDCNL